MRTPCTPMVQSRYDVASSKLVSSEILEDKCIHCVAQREETWTNIPAFETLKLCLLYPGKPRVLECTDEGILCQPFSYSNWFEGADAPP